MTSGEREGDFSLSLSSDVIAEVMGKHFNKEMFKKAVEIVDLKPLPDGYMFLLAYVQQQKVPPVTGMQIQQILSMSSNDEEFEEGINKLVENTPRAKNGRFTRKDA